MAKELELKLRCIEPVLWQSLLNAITSHGGMTVAESKEKQLINTYYDTSDLELNKRKVALRIREKDKQFIQTLKTAGFSIAGVHQRGEWEWVLAENALNKNFLRETKSWEPELARLEFIPVFNTDFMRTSQDFNLEGCLFELVLDRGKITTLQSESFELIDEFEVEFKSFLVTTDDVTVGSSHPALTHEEKAIEHVVSIMRELAAQLVKALPLALDDRSKAERGYRLFGAT